MSRPLDLDWISQNGLSNEISTIFMWRTGIFGFKLRSEKKKQIKSIGRSENMLSRFEMEHEAKVREYRSLETEIQSKFSGSTDDPEAVKMHTRKSQLLEEIESLSEEILSYESSLSKARKSLILIEDYSNFVIRNPDELESRKYQPGRLKGVKSILSNSNSNQSECWKYRGFRLGVKNMATGDQTYNRLLKTNPKKLSNLEASHAEARIRFEKKVNQMIETIHQEEVRYQNLRNLIRRDLNVSVEMAIRQALEAKIVRNGIIVRESALALLRANLFFHRMMIQMIQDARLGIAYDVQRLKSMIPSDVNDSIDRALKGMSLESILDPLKEEIIRGVNKNDQLILRNKGLMSFMKKRPKAQQKIIAEKQQNFSDQNKLLERRLDTLDTNARDALNLRQNGIEDSDRRIIAIRDQIQQDIAALYSVMNHQVRTHLWLELHKVLAINGFVAPDELEDLRTGLNYGLLDLEELDGLDEMLMEVKDPFEDIDDDFIQRFGA